MYYLGQQVAFSKWTAEKRRAAVIVGFADDLRPIIDRIDVSGELVRNDKVFTSEVFPIRIKSKHSPSGMMIFKGEFYKQGVIAPVKVKLPKDLNTNDKAMLSNLQVLQEIIDNHSTKE